MGFYMNAKINIVFYYETERKKEKNEINDKFLTKVGAFI